MNNVKMIGYFTVGDSKELHDDAYVIEKITKVAEGQWNFAARIQYGGRDVKVTLKIPVAFAGDTPVINFIRQTVQGMGTLRCARAVFQRRLCGDVGRGRSWRHDVRQDRQERPAGHTSEDPVSAGAARYHGLHRGSRAADSESQCWSAC